MVGSVTEVVVTPARTLLLVIALIPPALQTAVAFEVAAYALAVAVAVTAYALIATAYASVEEMAW